MQKTCQCGNFAVCLMRRDSLVTGISWMKNIWHEKANEQILQKYHCWEPVIQCL